MVGRPSQRMASAIVFVIAMGRGFCVDAVADDFYKDKQVQLLVSTEPGTTYDAYARALAEVLPNHIPGRPTFVVQNVPGAAGIKVTNYLYNQAPRDGTVLAATHAGIPTQQLLAPEGIQFDANKLSWLGSVTKDVSVGYVWHTVPVASYDETRRVQVSMGGPAVGSNGVDMAILSNALFGTKYKIITGYKSAPEVKLAVEKGEVDGTFANSWSALKQQVPTWLSEKKIRLLVQHGLKRHPEMPEVPLMIDEAKTGEDRQLLELMLARQETSKPYFAPPGIPADRLALLRDAFNASVKDEKFLQLAAKAMLPVDSPMGGEEVAALTARLSTTPAAVIRRMEGIFDKFKATQ
jgi:tripartite-type tricarboxylate transporter receptor subunit TctC